MSLIHLRPATALTLFSGGTNRLVRAALVFLIVGPLAQGCASSTATAGTNPVGNSTLEPVASEEGTEQPRTRSLLTLDPGQLDLQNEMYEWAESWYDLSFVRNSTPKEEDRSDPYRNTRPGFACTETEVGLANNIEDFPLFSAMPSNVFLGSIIKGDTLLTGTYGVFSGPRNSAKITLDSPYTSNPIGTETMAKISHSEYLDALRRVLRSGIGQVPAAIGFSVNEIFSQDQLAFKMKANVSGSNFDVAAQFSIDQSQTSRYALLSVNQAFFRAYLDRPDYGAEFWAEGIDPKEIELIKNEMTAFNPPLYVSAIDYGRKAYVLFESQDSVLDIQSTVEAGYEGVVSVDGEVSLDLRNQLESMSAKGFIIGGGSKIGANAISELFGGSQEDGFSALKTISTWIRDGAEPSETNPPAALSYEFSLLLDGSKASARTTTDYTEVNCDVGVCPSGFHWGMKYKATWFEINVKPQSKIYPAAGLIGDEIEIQDGYFYTYTFPLCNRVLWKNVALKCVPNERADFEAGKSPPGVWDWIELKDSKGDPLPRKIYKDDNCFDWLPGDENIGARRVNLDGGPPVPLDTGDEGFAESPAEYWRWRD